MTGQKGDRSFGGEVEGEELEVSMSHGHAEGKQVRKNPEGPCKLTTKECIVASMMEEVSSRLADGQLMAGLRQSIEKGGWFGGMLQEVVSELAAGKRGWQKRKCGGYVLGLSRWKVLMEVSCQLRRLNLEMDLGGVPRDQNTQADAPTNSIFDDFEESRRIVADFEEVELIVLRESTEEAGKLDEEIKTLKSS